MRARPLRVPWALLRGTPTDSPGPSGKAARPLRRAPSTSPPELARLSGGLGLPAGRFDVGSGPARPSWRTHPASPAKPLTLSEELPRPPARALSTSRPSLLGCPAGSDSRRAGSMSAADPLGSPGRLVQPLPQSQSPSPKRSLSLPPGLARPRPAGSGLRQAGSTSAANPLDLPDELTRTLRRSPSPSSPGPLTLPPELARLSGGLGFPAHAVGQSRGRMRPYASPSAPCAIRSAPAAIPPPLGRRGPQPVNSRHAVTWASARARALRVPTQGSQGPSDPHSQRRRVPRGRRGAHRTIRGAARPTTEQVRARRRRRTGRRPSR